MSAPPQPGQNAYYPPQEQQKPLGFAVEQPPPYAPPGQAYPPPQAQPYPPQQPYPGQPQSYQQPYPSQPYPQQPPNQGYPQGSTVIVQQPPQQTVYMNQKKKDTSAEDCALGALCMACLCCCLLSD